MLDGCRPASPPSVRAQRGCGPVNRIPVRSELKCTSYAVPSRSSMSVSVKNSGAPCGPIVTASCQSLVRAGCSSLRIRRGVRADTAGPGQVRRSPSASGLPCCPPKRPR